MYKNNNNKLLQLNPICFIVYFILFYFILFFLFFSSHSVQHYILCIVEFIIQILNVIAKKEEKKMKQMENITK